MIDTGNANMKKLVQAVMGPFMISDIGSEEVCWEKPTGLTYRQVELVFLFLGYDGCVYIL